MSFAKIDEIAEGLENAAMYKAALEAYLSKELTSTVRRQSTNWWRSEVIPVKFREQNMTIAEDQKPYLPLHAYRTPDGIITTCWSPTFKERLMLVFCRKPLWLQIMTFNRPLQPLKITVEKPHMPDMSFPRKKRK